MNIFTAAILGIIQGATEFLPISSSGHLALAHYFFGAEEASLTFDVALHLGTLLAILIYFRRDLLNTKWWPWLILGSVPAAIVGFTLEDQIDALFRSAQSVGIFMMIMGALFLIPQRQNDKPINGWRALLMGCGQALAVIPGISRSGATIFTGMQLGMKREEAARFSFLLGAIAIAGAGLLKALDTQTLELPLAILSAGFLAAFLLLIPFKNRRAIFVHAAVIKIKTGALIVSNKAMAGIASIFLNFAIYLGSATLINAAGGIQHLFILILAVIVAKIFPQALEEKTSIGVIARKIFSILLIGAGLAILGFYS